ncbi:MAG: flagellar brake protein [Algicola sp.]|nr:flagellar brake protein [Algicola sp.]
MESYTFYETRQHSPLYVKKLRPGCPLTVQVVDGNKMRFTSHLIGYEVGNYLLVALPMDVRKQFQGNLLVTGAQAVVRLLLEGEEGKCLAFKSNIESCVTHPHDFIFLSFPKMVESCELRKYPRLSTCMSAYVCSTGSGTEEVLNGRMQDVSLGGCRFAFDMPNKARNVNYKNVEFLLGEDPASPIIRFPGEIRSQRMLNGQMQVGIKFDSDEITNEKELMRLHIDRDSLLGAF